MDTYTAHQADLFPPEVVHLLGTARQLIDRHINDGGICADCGLSWPCQRAQLAELTLGTL